MQQGLAQQRRQVLAQPVQPARIQVQAELLEQQLQHTFAKDDAGQHAAGPAQVVAGHAAIGAVVRP